MGLRRLYGDPFLPERAMARIREVYTTTVERVPQHTACFLVKMHFHDVAEARAVVDAASVELLHLDEKRLWKISLERCPD